MNDENFTALVQKLETLSRDFPNRYKIQVLLLAILGYAYIFLVLIALAIPIALLIGVIIYSHRISYPILKLIFLLSIPVYLIARSLLEAVTMKFPPPEGWELSREEVPHLFATIEGITTAFRCPPLHHVLLTTDYNAAIVQIPRFGWLGWGENYLLIGLPLLQSLSIKEFKAVLAHEFGHLSGNHGSFQGWIYRLRQTWARLLDRMSSRNGSSNFILFDRFFSWYIPFFNAYSFVLARSDEYEADRCAVSLVGREATASALIGVNVRGYWLDNQFWAPLYQRVTDEADPPGQPFTDLATLLRGTIADSEARQYLEQAIARSTDLSDTHPCLHDRLLAIDHPVDPLFFRQTSPSESAADTLLGTALPCLIDRLNEGWRTAITFQWKEEHAKAQAMRQQLADLDRQSGYRTLLIEEAWQQASLTARVRGDESAFPLLRSLLQRNPDHSPANFLLGQILLMRGEDRGIEYLEKAMGNDPALVIEGCQAIAHFYRERGFSVEANHYRQRAELHYHALQQANEERSGVNAGDRFLPHGLSIETVTALRRQLANHRQIHSAYLVRKAVNTFPEIPFYVLGILCSRRPFQFGRFQSDRLLVEHLAETLSYPGQTWIVILNSSNRRLGRSLQNVDNSLIYS
jgi:Zn-dependent protease with chaperone function